MQTAKQALASALDEIKSLAPYRDYLEVRKELREWYGRRDAARGALEQIREVQKGRRMASSGEVPARTD